MSVEALTREALERAVDYDDWVHLRGLNRPGQIDAGQTLTHDVVGKRLAKKLADNDAGR